MARFKWLIMSHNHEVTKFFEKRGYDTLQYSQRNDKFDGVVFTGGEDVTPYLYGEPKHKTTQCNLERDLKENAFFRTLSNDIPKIGICRGAQFLNVMNHGTMWQDVTMHNRGSHLAKSTYDPKGKPFTVTSTHHQMMKPHKDAWIMLTANVCRRLESPGHVYLYDESNNDDEDIEAVHYLNTNSFCFQPHPEYGHATSECISWFWEAVDFLFDKQLKRALERTG